MPGLKITLLQQPLVWMDGPANLRHFGRLMEEIVGRDVIVRFCDGSRRAVDGGRGRDCLDAHAGAAD